MSYRKTTTLTVLRIVEEQFDDDEHPSLPGMPVVETDGTDVTDQYRPLAKCGAVAGERRKAGVR